MARKNSSTTKNTPLNLDTAIQADGALQAPRSVYEIVGIRNVSYREKTFEAYQSALAKMDLIELQDHAYALGVPPGATRTIAIARLEEKYLRENPHERDRVVAARQATVKDDEQLSIKERAERILARGR